MASDQSQGHLAYDSNGNEWYERDGEVYRAPVYRPVMTDGYRCGRWECSMEHAARFPGLFPFNPTGDRVPS